MTARETQAHTPLLDHTVFFAGGLSGPNARADGNGGLLARGYYFCDAKGTHGPFPNPRVADRHCTEAMQNLRYDRLSDEFTAQADLLVDALAALRQIAKGEGAFNRDPLKHAENVIEEAKELARAVLSKTSERQP